MFSSILFSIFIEKLGQWIHAVGHMSHKVIAQGALPASGVRMQVKVKISSDIAIHKSTFSSNLLLALFLTSGGSP